MVSAGIILTTITLNILSLASKELRYDKSYNITNRVYHDLMTHNQTDIVWSSLNLRLHAISCLLTMEINKPVLFPYGQWSLDTIEYHYLIHHELPVNQPKAHKSWYVACLSSLLTGRFSALCKTSNNRWDWINYVVYVINGSIDSRYIMVIHIIMSQPMWHWSDI